MSPRRSEVESTIGAAARRFRQRRGLSLAFVGGRSGIGGANLSKIERGLRGITQRAMIENLAEALGCSVADLTGEPYPARDRPTAEALTILPNLTVALYEDPRAYEGAIRPVAELVAEATMANELCEESRYWPAGRDLHVLLPQLHNHTEAGRAHERRAAYSGLVEAYVAAFGVARHLGRPELALQAAQRARAAAEALDDPAYLGFARLMSASGFSRLGARTAARTVLRDAMNDLAPLADPARQPAAAEALGVMHLVSAQLAARDHRADEARTHLDEADELARRTGERNTLHWRFGPANVTNWRLTIAIEQGEGVPAAERHAATPPDLVTAGRRCRYHFDLARGYAQAEGTHDREAIEHLDHADRIAPTRMRLDPLARELAHALRVRQPRRTWLADSLCRRFGATD